MKTIHAMVNTRLLRKASRLFTGTLEGRVIEILQNTRRAGATEVHITNTGGIVTVQDNGRGIEDFSKLLDLGGSDWDGALEASEDPAGVGIFCLAPRDVTVRSNGRMATIKRDGWTGAPVEVTDGSAPVTGTMLEFRDEAWNSTAVDRNAVFCGMRVTVDGHACPRLCEQHIDVVRRLRRGLTNALRSAEKRWWRDDQINGTLSPRTLYPLVARRFPAMVVCFAPAMAVAAWCAMGGISRHPWRAPRPAAIQTATRKAWCLAWCFPCRNWVHRMVTG